MNKCLDCFHGFCIVSDHDNLILRVYELDKDGFNNLDHQIDIPVLDILLKLCALHLTDGDVNKLLKGEKK